MAKKTPPPVVETPPTQGYTVLARRYRPQAFEQLIGQDHVARSLRNALESSRVAHAYLFTGARGVGKTSTARILAKCLNCEKGPTILPCNECDICKSITSGEDVDVLEIDGASNRGIDNIRDIRANVQFRPARARFKIYIIDEVHMVTKEAFNALLKTLEEPPTHVKFIFATTEANKIPITILSRCQRFDFAGISLPQIVAQLRDIVEREGMQADDEALEMVARRAAGSMRDAQSLLDQLLAFGSERLTADRIHEMLGTAGDDRVVELASAVLAHDPHRAIELLADLAARTLQPGELLDQLMSYWRDLMVIRVAGDEAQDMSFPSRHRETLQKQSIVLPLDSILAGLEVLSAARNRLKFTTNGRLAVEMALVRLCQLENLASLSQLAQLVHQSPGERETPSPRAARPAVPPEGVKKKLTEPLVTRENDQPLSLTADTLPRVWTLVLQSLPPLMASQLEKAGLPAISGPNALALRFGPGYNGEREYCSETNRLLRVESSLQKVTGRDWKLRIEAGGQNITEQEISSPAPPESDNGLTKARKQREGAETIPLIRRAQELLGAQVVRVEEGFNATAETPLRSAVEEGEETLDPEEG